MPYYQRNLLILSFTVFLAAFSWNQVMPFLPLFLMDVGITENLPFWSGILFSAQFVATIIMGPFWGKMSDRYGRKLMVVRAGFFLVVIYFGMSVCQTFWQLLILRMLNGALTGFIPGSIALIATNTPQQLSGRYLSIIHSASAFGAIIGPALGGLLASLFGYRGSMILSGLLVLSAMLMVYWLVEEREKPAPVEPTSIWQDYKLAFAMPVMLGAMLADFTNAIVNSSIQPVLALYINEMAPHASRTLSGLVFALPGLAMVLTAYSWSRLGEKISYQRSMLIALIGVSISGILLGFTHSVPAFALVYFILGIFAAAVTPTAAALVATKIDPQFRGRAYGLQHAARTFGFFLAPLNAGIIGNSIGLNSAFLAMGTVSLLMTLGLRVQMRSWGKGAAVTECIPVKAGE